MRRLAGFTLLEVCISMIIFGIIAGASIPLLSSFINAEKNRRTENHKEQIIAALASYLIRNSKLPCPSRTTDNKGIKEETCLQRNQCKGIVPYVSLGLPESTAKDGFGQWFTYAVDPNLTRTTSIGIPARLNSPYDHSNEFSNAHCDSLELYGNQMIARIREYTNIAFVLISHGPQGSGAYHPDRIDHKLTATTAHELFNSADDLKFCIGQAEDYHHKVFYLNRDYFMSHYAKIPNGTAMITTFNDPSTGRNNPDIEIQYSTMQNMNETAEEIRARNLNRFRSRMNYNTQQ